MARFEFLSSGSAVIEEQVATPVSGVGGIQVGRTICGFRLETDASMLDIDLARGVARGVLRESFWTIPPDAQRRFLLLALVMLAHGHGRYALHANGVALRDRGCLIVGPSGCGKTTLGVTLARHGWAYLSDDVVMLGKRSENVVAFGVTRGLSCTATTAAGGPGLPGHVNGTADKALMRARDVGLLQQAEECRPLWLLFPKIVPRPASQLVPLVPAAAMGWLIQHSAGILVDRTKSVDQLAVLKRLVGQARCFQFLAGTDVLRSPPLVARWLAEALE